MTFALLVSVGCAVQERAKPISNTFLEDRDVTVADDLIPFNHAWIDPATPEDYYTKVFFRSVSVDHLAKDAWLESRSPFMTTEDAFQEEARRLADFFRQQLALKASKYPNATMEVAQNASERTLVFDIAITELDFTHPIEKAGVMLVPIPASSIAFSALSDPHVAFAARVYDGKSGKLVATLADRKFPPTRLLDVNKLTVTSSAREIVISWAEIIAEGLNRDRFTKVSNRGIFSILPW